MTEADAKTKWCPLARLTDNWIAPCIGTKCIPCRALNPQDGHPMKTTVYTCSHCGTTHLQASSDYTVPKHWVEVEARTSDSGDRWVTRHFCGNCFEKGPIHAAAITLSLRFP